MEKTHDIPIQEKLDEVKDMVHDMDEELDTMEDKTKKAEHSCYLVRVNGADFGRYETKADAEMACANLKMDGVFATIVEQTLLSEKSQAVEKPGDTVHTVAWDRCVKEVGAKGDATNAYAVCTAQLGEESFKSQFKHLAKGEVARAKYQVFGGRAYKDMGIGFAGPIPSSLLADQDLEGETKKDTTSYANQLDAVAEKAPDASTSQRNVLVSRIKRIQMKAQKDTIKERADEKETETEKSFADVWRDQYRGAIS